MNGAIEKSLSELDELCRRRGWSVGLAESCTAGLLASWIGARPGVSKWFHGAVVSYSRQVKAQILGVPLKWLSAHGEVSLPVARAMAQGARLALLCDWAVSVTGIAGPSGGTPTKPVGTVCFAVSGPGFDEVWLKNFPPTAERHAIQEMAAAQALEFLLLAMK
jgi:PncC family amidohydrolase